MKQKMGIHVLLNLFGCSKACLKGEEKLKEIMYNVVSGAGLFLVGTPGFHVFEPEGITAFFMLAESHLSIHTWPEHGSAAVDIFCCYMDEKNKDKAGEKAEKAAEILIKDMEAKEYEKKIVVR